MSKSDSPMDLLLLQMCPLSRHLNLSKKKSFEQLQLPSQMFMQAGCSLCVQGKNRI